MLQTNGLKHTLIQFVSKISQALTEPKKTLQKLFPEQISPIAPEKPGSMLGGGFIHRKRRFVTHTTLPHQQSAIYTLTGSQKISLLVLMTALSVGLIFKPLTTGIVFVGLVSLIYFLDVVFSLFVILKSLHFPQEITATEADLVQIKDEKLPMYSILCPLYKEGKILPQFVTAITRLEWPKSKLEVLLLLESDDHETVTAAQQLKLPEYFRVIKIPVSDPKTKPKALNYGLHHTRGEYVVIYDAEDMPDPWQLKKAYLGFSRVGKNVACLQAKLNYYNPHHNLLTQLFTAEYSLWFDVVLPGLQSIATSIPLGGTSNHFRTAVLRQLHGWDPFNVTEDCDLGVRLFKAGYKTAMIDSTTLEEANSDLKNWLRQRSRWIKGYIQTYLVHMRSPWQFAKTQGIHAVIFQLVVGGKTAFMLINPFLWLATIAYFTLFAIVGPTIESLYPPVIFYMAATSLVLGNFIYLYNYMIGCAKRGHWNLIKYVYLVPFYWLFVSVGAGIALTQLVFKPHYWEKTIHGLHFDKVEKDTARKLLKIKSRQVRAMRWQRLADLAQTNLVSGGILIGASFLGNILNFLYNAYLGRTMNLAEFGLINLIGSFIYLSQVPLGAIGRTVTHKSAYLFGKYTTPVKEFWTQIRHQSLRWGLMISGVWLLAIPFLKNFFQVESLWPFVLFTPVWLVGALSAVDDGFLGGNLKFVNLAVIVVTEALVKLILTVVFVSLKLNAWVYAAIPLAMTVAFLVRWASIVRLKSQPLPEVDRKPALVFPRKFFVTSILMKLTGVAFLGFDVVLAKHYLTPVAAGSYAFLALVGKMVFFISSLFSQFITPVVSRDEGAGKNSRATFNRLLLATTLVGLGGFVGLGVFSRFTVPLLWGPKAQNILPYLPLYTLAMVDFSVLAALVGYHQIRRRYLFPIVNFLLALGQVVGIVLFHQNIETITWVIVINALVSLLVMATLHAIYPVLERLWFSRNLVDLWGLFGKLPQPQPVASGNLRILVFNWRDTRHRWAGGAEVYIQELAKRWVKMGHEVTVFCGNLGDSPRYETLDGVKIIRRGGFYFVYIWAFLYYIFRLKGKYDVIIDSENGIPFFTPLYAKERIFLLIHHVHQEVFRKSLKPPWSWLASFLEMQVMPVVYRQTQVVTVSPSSKADILDHRLTQKEPEIVYNGVDTTRFKPGIKSRLPLILYLGRLKSYKSLHVLIAAAKKIIDVKPQVRFLIAGEGEERSKLMDLVKKLGLVKQIKFLGKVTEEEKISLYQKAWVFVNPSLMEGWGITSIEANACGTPVVASNVSGLRDSVYNPHSGLLVPYGEVDQFAEQILKILNNKDVRQHMFRAAIDWAKNFTWDKSARESLNLLQRN